METMNKTKMLVIMFFMFLVGCGDGPSQQVNVNDRPDLFQILEQNIFHPYNYELLITNAEGSYGPPRDKGDNFDRESRHVWKEYLGKYGQIQIHYFHESGEDGGSSGRYLELTGTPLNLDDVLQKDILARIYPYTGKKKLYLESIRNGRGWCFTIYTDGNRVERIAYTLLPNQ